MQLKKLKVKFNVSLCKIHSTYKKEGAYCIYSVFTVNYSNILHETSQYSTLVLMLRQFVFCSIPVNEKKTCLSLFFSSCLPCAERFPHGKIHVLHWFMGWLQQTVAVSTLFANLKLVLLAFSLDSRRAL